MLHIYPYMHYIPQINEFVVMNHLAGRTVDLGDEVVAFSVVLYGGLWMLCSHFANMFTGIDIQVL